MQQKPEPSGQRVVFWLFVSLAVCTAIALTVLAQQVDATYRPRVYGALVGDLAIPVIAWFLLKAIARRQAKKAQEPRWP